MAKNAKSGIIALFLLLYSIMFASVTVAQNLPKDFEEFKRSIKKSEEESRQFQEIFRQRMRETLRDVKSLKVRIFFSGDFLFSEHHDFHDELTSLVTDKLKKVGIDVIDWDENTFHINLATCKRGNGRTFYSIITQFYQPVLVKRKPSVEQNAATWWNYKWDETEQYFYLRIKDEVDAITNTFIIDYLLVNPSTTR